MSKFASKTVWRVIAAVTLVGCLSLCALAVFGGRSVSRAVAAVGLGDLQKVAYQEFVDRDQSSEVEFEEIEMLESDGQVEFELSLEADDVVVLDAPASSDGIDAKASDSRRIQNGLIQNGLIQSRRIQNGLIQSRPIQSGPIQNVQVETPVKENVRPPSGEVITNKFVHAGGQGSESKAFVPSRSDSVPGRVVVANEFFKENSVSQSQQVLNVPDSIVDDARRTLATLQNQIQRADVATQAMSVPQAPKPETDREVLNRIRRLTELTTPSARFNMRVEQQPDVEQQLDVEPAGVVEPSIQMMPATDLGDEGGLNMKGDLNMEGGSNPESNLYIEGEAAPAQLPTNPSPMSVPTTDDHDFLQRIKQKINGAEARNEPDLQSNSTVPPVNSQVASLEFNSESSGNQQAQLASAKLPAAKPPAAKPAAKPPVKGGGPKPVTQGTTDFKLAGQPELGAHFKDDTPVTDRSAWQIEVFEGDFSPDAIDPNQTYDPYSEMQVYEGKQLNANQRPLVELGRPWYQLGQLSPGSSIFGAHNNVVPQFIVHGDYRTAVASNTNNGDNVSQIAFELNLNLDLRLTSTERIVGFVAPLDNGRNSNTRYLFDEGRFEDETDFDFDFGYFEGDLGAIAGGFIGETLPFDLPFAVGVLPLLVQNGIWLEDAFLGAAFTIPARNSARLGISNIDTTFFAGFDEIDSPAFEGDDDTAKMYGVLTFIEALNGYFEIDYAYLEDRDRGRDRSYHNIGLAYTRRYGRFISNSTRVIINAGQSTEGGPNTADGVLLLSENSLTTAHPANLIPYVNFFAGFDNPQSAARSGSGILRNTGILFESDGITGFPTLDDSANDTFGASFGINMLAPDFSQQLVLEFSALGVMGEDPNRNAAGDQYGLGFRYQLPLSNSVILRVDGMQGFLRNADDNRGLRVEMRHKF